MGRNNDTISCAYYLGQHPSGLQPKIIAVNVTVQDGPIFSSDDPLYSSVTPLSPVWQYSVIPLLNQTKTTFSLYNTLNLTLARNYTRVVSCLVTAIDPMTTFPIYIQAPPMVVLEYGERWVNFTSPLPGTYTPSIPGIM